MGLTVGDVSGIGAVATLATDLVDRIFPDKVAQATERAQYLIQAQTLDNQMATAQAAVDQVEAGNTSIFVSGWRPAVGWACAIAFGYHMIIQPLISYILAIKGVIYTMPTFNDSLLSTTLMGMLGLGAMRTVENMGSRGHLPWQKDTSDNS